MTPVWASPCYACFPSTFLSSQALYLEFYEISHKIRFYRLFFVIQSLPGSLIGEKGDQRKALLTFCLLTYIFIRVFLITIREMNILQRYVDILFEYFFRRSDISFKNFLVIWNRILNVGKNLSLFCICNKILYDA